MQVGSVGMASLGGSDSQPLNTSAGATSPEGFTGAGGPASKMVHSHGSWHLFFAGCWQEAAILYHVGLSIGPLEYPYATEASFLQREWSKTGLAMCFMTSAVTDCHFLNILLVTQVSPHLSGRGTTHGQEFQETILQVDSHIFPRVMWFLWERRNTVDYL